MLFKSLYSQIVRVAKPKVKERDIIKAQWMIRPGDYVVILAGKEKGRFAKVEKLVKDDNTVILENAMTVVRSMNVEGQQLYVNTMKPIHYSNLALAFNTPSGPIPTRVRLEMIDGEKVRVAVSRRAIEAAGGNEKALIMPFPKPPVKVKLTGPYDTEQDLVHQVTYVPMFDPPIPKKCYI